MEFLRYCYSIDIDLTDDFCRTFGDGVVFGYVIRKNVYLGITGVPDLFCHFYNDDPELSNESLCKLGKNINSFIKHTVETIIHLK